MAENPLENLVLPKGKIKNFIINDTKLKSLELSGLPYLTFLRVERGRLEGEIDLSACPELERCDLSQNPALKTIWLAKGQNIRDFHYDSTAQVRYR